MAAILIKKYGNRRLYDTGDSKYVTLEELANKIRSGADLRVVDAQTGDDLTQATLVQIVLEAGNAAKFLPVQLLTQMIRLSDDSLAEFFSRYVTGALDLYLQARRGVQLMASFNPLAQLPVAASDALARMWMGSPFAAPAYQQYSYATAPGPYSDNFRPAPPPSDDNEDAPRERPSSPAVRRPATEPGRSEYSDATNGDRDRGDRAERADRAERGDRLEHGNRGERAGGERAGGERAGAERGERNERAERGERTERDRERDDVAAMRRELDELKQVIREGLGASKPARKKRKP